MPMCGSWVKWTRTVFRDGRRCGGVDLNTFVCFPFNIWWIYSQSTCTTDDSISIEEAICSACLLLMNLDEIGERECNSISPSALWNGRLVADWSRLVQQHSRCWHGLSRHDVYILLVLNTYATSKLNRSFGRETISKYLPNFKSTYGKRTLHTKCCA